MLLIKDAFLINEGERYKASVLIGGERIVKIFREGDLPEGIENSSETIHADKLWLIPGAIDDQVHFRDPGLTYKEDLYSGSRAAVAGGVTSFMDMPNTRPQTVTVDELDKKFDHAAETSLANYSFFIGATNDNLEELKKKGAKRAAALKVFMGASTGNMLVDNKKTLEKIFSEIDMIIATHCESEPVIRANKEKYLSMYGEDLDIYFHNKIRNEEACYASSSEAVELASKYGARLHVFHLSTAKETTLFEKGPLKDKKITAEVCIHHLWFSEEDYSRLGNLIKWNPSIKTLKDRDTLRIALKEGRLDVVATDHAPHLLSEKQGSCLKAASGGPLVQHSLVAMMELYKQGVFTPELIVEKMCHAPADLFRIKDRGYIREGYYADLVLIDPDKEWKVDKRNLLYKCGWSPFEGQTFSTRIVTTFVNGHIVYDKGRFDENYRGKELCFR